MEKVASESQKTPRDVVMMENFHHIFSTLSRLKISCLDAERREAKQKYTDHLQSYVINSLGQPLEKLNVSGKMFAELWFMFRPLSGIVSASQHFFEGVEARVAQGVREEEVSYHLAFNKQELRKVIKEYPGKEVKKGLDNLYKKVDKHLCEEESLLQVVDVTADVDLSHSHLLPLNHPTCLLSSPSGGVALHAGRVHPSVQAL